MIDTAELMKKVAGIRILTNRLIDDQLSGDYHSMFKGQGVEFDEVRPYVPGDDIRMIDWNVTARTGHPFIKRFSEERELTVFFVVDVSGSQAFGSTGQPKAELAAEITSLLALTAVRNQDKVGLVLFTDRIIKAIPPRKGRTAVMRLVREVLAADATREKTDLAQALRFVNSIQKRRAVVFLVSDFQADDYERELRVFAKRHDVVACPITDPAELTLPNLGLVELLDPETGDLILTDTSSARVRKAFHAAAVAEREALFTLLRRTGIDTVPLVTGQPYIDSVRRLFHRRAHRRR